MSRRRGLGPARVKRHVLLGALAGLSVLLAFVILGFSGERWVDIDDLKRNMFEWRMSMALALSALLFLSVVLAIGPLNLIRKRPNPTNSYLRRDLGIWTSVLALAHVVFGISIHTDGGRFWTLWIMDMSMPGQLLPLQTGWFGIANFAGLLQACIFALLLVVSNDIAMRRLGMRRWKTLQRLSYVAVVSIMVHGLAYQRVEDRELGLRLAFWGIVAIIVAVQGLGLFIALRQSREKKSHLASK